MARSKANSPLPDSFSFVDTFEDIEEPVVDDSLEQKLAKLRNSPDGELLIQHFRDRQDFYRHYLPGGEPIHTLNERERAAYWQVASVVIQEFEVAIQIMEGVADAVKASKKT